MGGAAMSAAGIKSVAVIRRRGTSSGRGWGIISGFLVPARAVRSRMISGVSDTGTPYGERR